MVAEQQLCHGLVVDDHTDALNWVRMSLREAFPHISVVTAQSVAEANAQIDERVPDIAIIDLGLPDGTGIDLIQRIFDTNDCTYRIVSTVFADDRHIFDALRAGAQGYVLKDDSQQELVNMLRGITQGFPPLSPSIASRVLAHFHAPSEPTVKLTPRETDVLTLLAQGHSVKGVAGLLDLTPSTTATYVKNIYQKLNVNNRAEATVEAGRRRLIDLA